MTRLAKSTNYEWVVTVGERLAAGAIISSKRRQNKFQVVPVKFEDALQGPDGINPRKAGILTMSYTSAEIYEVLCPPDGIGERDARMAEFFLSWQQRSSACGSMVRKLQVLRELGLLGTEFVNGILYGANIFGLAVIITNGDNLMRALEDQINIMNKKVGYTDNGPIGL
jgi:hypothetical protein